MKTTLLALLFLAPVLLNAQVGIGTTNPEAQLDIRSTNQASPSITDGILIPKVDEYPAANPTVAQDGMLIYATGNGSVGKGFYYWDNGITSWVLLGSGAGTDHDFYEEGSTVAPDDINDDIFTQGYLAIGKNTADYSLDVFSDISTRGINNILESADATIVDGIYNEVENTGSGGQRGVLNRLTGNSAGIQIATGNYVINTGNSAQYGSINSITGPGNGVHYGNRNSLSGLGTGLHYGTFNRLEGTGTGEQFGTRTEIVNSGNANHYGTSNLLSGSGSGQHFGTYTEMSGGGTGVQYGTSHFITNTGNTSQYGVFNTLIGSGSGSHYGMVNSLGGAGSGGQLGTFTSINNSGNGDHTGFYSQLTGSGTGDKIGIDVFVLSSAGGTHYGINSNVTKAGSYAGFFRGAVAIGTNLLNTYTFPPSRGMAGQVMQTDGSGNLSWVDPSTLTPAPFSQKESALNGSKDELSETLQQDISILLDALGISYNQGVSDKTRMSYNGLSVIAIKAIKEQQQIIDQQQSEIDALKQEMETIKLLLKNK